VKIQILYQTQYSYAEPVSFSLHLFRLFPRTERHVTVRSTQFQTNIGAAVSFRRDLFDNEIASCFYPGKSALLAANLQIALDVEEKNAFGFLLESRALELPFAYTSEEARVLAPYLSSSPGIQLPFWQKPTARRPTVETLVELNSSIHDALQYERREEGAARSAEETLSLGSGACRDFAVLMAESLRSLGLAARLVSGYLCEFGEGEKRAEGALHAWVETYLPGAGWLGLDPTNGVLCNHYHLTTAVGLTAADISPVLGDYYHSTRVHADMSSSLQIIPQAA
jgi:transglutaminase-like putative cysteine protease